MGLGRLNPGCKIDCQCSGCFGSIALIGSCEIRWATGGDPFAVELIRDGTLVSNAESGSLYSPDSGTYVLRIRCVEEDDFVEADRLVYVAPPSGCFSCCQSAGSVTSPGDITIVEIEMGNLPWSFFNGSYTLGKLVTSCGGQAANYCKYHTKRCVGGVLLPTYTWPRGQPGITGGSTGSPSKCFKIPAANLYQNGYYAGNWTYSTPHGQLVYEVWYLPSVIDITVTFGDPTWTSSTFLSHKLQRVEVTASMLVGLIGIDQITQPPANRSCYLESSCSAIIYGDIPCGNSSLVKSSSNYSYTPPSVYTPAIQPSTMIATVFP